MGYLGSLHVIGGEHYCVSLAVDVKHVTALKVFMYSCKLLDTSTVKAFSMTDVMTLRLSAHAGVKQDSSNVSFTVLEH